MRSTTARRCSAALFLLASATPGHAANVSFVGAVANLCVLTVTTPGTLGVATSGTTLSSDEAGGLPATMTVVATGSLPTISFGAPQLAGPTASTSGATKEIEYSSIGGVLQSYNGGASSAVLVRLTDTFTIKGRVSNSAGFVTGTYTLSSTATCQQ